MPTQTHYDLFVIGAGSGLNVASAMANQHNWQVALIEEGPLGGTCLNRGCIPSKIMIHTAELVESISRASEFGVDVTLNAIDFAKITSRANDLVDADSQNIEHNIIEHPNIELFKGRGKFVESKKVVVNDNEITADRVLIAAGARPFVPPIPGLDTVDYWTSTEALRQTTQPKSLIIIGGGYIGMELGHFYGSLGTEITVIETLDLLLAREDKEVAKTFTRLFSKKYPVYLRHQITQISQSADGMKIVLCKDEEGMEHTFKAEALLVVTGTKPNTDTLGLENTAVQTTERGFIQTDEYMRTTEENVWALGDIVGKAPFKHGANYEAQAIMQNMLTPEKAKVDYTIMPHAVFSSPQIAGVGLTEEMAKEQNVAYEILKKDYSKTGMGQAMLEKDGFVKFLINPETQTILGCHIIGPDASTLIHEVVVAMTAAEGKVSAIQDTIHIHPALSEVVQRAL